MERAAIATAPAILPKGVIVRALVPHEDERGCFTEIFRDEWGLGVQPMQWNAVRSEAGTLRGVHVHLRHADYLVVPIGRATIGLGDLRPDSPSFGVVATVEMTGEHPSGIEIPPGVAHGFLFHEPSLHIYAVTHYFDPADELGCRWDDPDLAIPWPERPRLVSERDEAAGTYAELCAVVSRS
jgi:dTDP-4-dehydrorhamnose 3,5-epimerase